MMIKIVKKVVLASMVLSGSLMADSLMDTGNAKSLIAIEGNYNSMGGEVKSASPSKTHDYTMGGAGLKIGAETGSYRVFLSARYLNGSDFDYITAYGVEGQYLLDISKSANIFIGVNGGIANMKFLVSGEGSSRTVSSSYYGLDVGANYHASDSIDLELGTRVMDIQAENTKNLTTYKFDTIISVYASVIFKYQMD